MVQHNDLETKTRQVCRRLLKSRLRLHLVDVLTRSLHPDDIYMYAYVVRVERAALAKASTEWAHLQPKLVDAGVDATQQKRILQEAYQDALRQVDDVFSPAHEEAICQLLQDVCSTRTVEDWLSC